MTCVKLLARAQNWLTNVNGLANKKDHLYNIQVPHTFIHSIYQYLPTILGFCDIVCLGPF